MYDGNEFNSFLCAAFAAHLKEIKNICKVLWNFLPFTEKKKLYIFSWFEIINISFDEYNKMLIRNERVGQMDNKLEDSEA